MKAVNFRSSNACYKYIEGFGYTVIRKSEEIVLESTKYDYARLEMVKNDWINSLPKVQHIKGTKTYIIALDGKKYTYIRGCEIPFMQYGMYESERPALFDELGNLVDYDSKELNKVIEAFKDWKWTYNL